MIQHIRIAGSLVHRIMIQYIRITGSPDHDIRITGSPDHRMVAHDPYYHDLALTSIGRIAPSSIKTETGQLNVY